MHGCALAAIASVTNKTYYQAEEKIRRPGFNPNNGICTSDIRWSLAQLGIEPPPSVFIPRKFRTERWIKSFLSKQKGSCILLVDNDDAYDGRPGTAHCIVWDKKHRCYWDPGRNGNAFYDYEYVYRIIVTKK